MEKFNQIVDNMQQEVMRIYEKNFFLVLDAIERVVKNDFHIFLEGSRQMAIEISIDKERKNTYRLNDLTLLSQKLNVFDQSTNFPQLIEDIMFLHEYNHKNNSFALYFNQIKDNLRVSMTVCFNEENFAEKAKELLSPIGWARYEKYKLEKTIPETNAKKTLKI